MAHREEVRIKQAHIRTEDAGHTHVLRVATEGEVQVSVAWRRGVIVQVSVDSREDYISEEAQ